MGTMKCGSCQFAWSHLWLALGLLWITSGSRQIIASSNAGGTTGRLRPILLDESRCPLGWTGAGERCVQLQFMPSRLAQAEADCRRMGAQLVDVLDSDGQPRVALIEDLSEALEEALNLGVPEQSWLVGSGHFQPEWDTTSERVRFRAVPKGGAEESTDTERPTALGLRRRRGQQPYELVLLANSSAQPFVCALTPMWRRIRLYQQALLPRGAPRLEEEPQASYFFDPSSTNDSFLSLPCTASGQPPPTIRWFRNGGEEIVLNASNSSPFIVSGGALLVPLSRLPPSPLTFHCLARNPLGTVRSQTATLRPSFIEPFRESRLDAFPLISGASKGGGARLECNAPRHFPKSFSFSWVRGGSYEKFVEVSPRLFISMEGTLHFAYNVREDEDSYACTLTSAATQSAQHGPFFRLFLPLGHINPKLRKQPGQVAHHQHPHAFPPRIDEFQPQLYPEVPTRGRPVYMECFAYGFPVPTYKWSRVDGQPLPSGRHKLLSFGRILRIDRAEMADSGRYRCSVQNELGTASAELRLAVQAPPSLLRPLVDRIVAPGTPSVSLHCHVAMAAGLQVEWFRNGMPLVPLLLGPEDRDRFRLNANELVISSVQRSDSAIYQCSASNEVGSVSSSALLQVEWIPPRFHGNVFPSRLFIVEGTRLALPCLFQSSPPGRTQWTRLIRGQEGEELEQPVHQLVDSSLAEEPIALLSLESAQPLDSGDYQCEAHSDSGAASARVRLDVIPRPKVQIRTETGSEGGTQVLSCELEMNCTRAEQCPEALFSWEFNERPIRSLAFANPRERIRTRQHELVQQQRRRSAEHGPVVVQQQSQLLLPAQFAKSQVGRFACSSLFGGATADLEPVPSMAVVPVKLSVKELDESGMAKLLYRTIQLGQSGGVSGSAIKRRGFAIGTDGRPEKQQQVFQLEARTARERRWRPLRQVELGEEGSTSDWPIAGEISLEGLEPNQRYQFRLVPLPSGELLPSGPVASLSEWVLTPEAVPSQPVEGLRFRMLDDRHVLLEWEPVERGHLSAPELRYNVSWKVAGREQAELVEAPRLVISLPQKQQQQPNGMECQIVEVGVRPVNRKGPAKMATSTVIRASGKAPQRVATGLRLNTLNATHLNLTWHWSGEDPCENVIGTKIVCTEEKEKRLSQTEGKLGHEHDEKQEEKQEEHTPNSTREVSQSVPADYGQWLVHSLQPERDYACRVFAFDQYGRMGPTRPEAVARARTAERAPSKGPEISFVLVKEADGLAGGDYAVLLDWRAVPLAASYGTKEEEEAAVSNQLAMERARHRGYKIFVYVSETADQPIVLTLTEAELHDALRPSARIDGLRPMFFYGIQVAAFNPGGIGPRSERIPVRIGAREQPHPALVRDQHQNSNGTGTRRLPMALYLLLTLAASLLLLPLMFISSCCSSSLSSLRSSKHSRKHCGIIHPSEALPPFTCPLSNKKCK